MRVYWDTCVLVYDTERVAPFFEAIRAARDSIPPHEIASSDLVRMESLVGPLSRRDDPLIEAYRRRLDAMTDLPLDRETFDLATELRAEHRLKTPDALHVACALRHHCDEIWTNDRRLSVMAYRLSVRVIG